MHTVLIVPGLRDHVQTHWQTKLASHLNCAVSIQPMGRDNLSCEARVKAIEFEVAKIKKTIIIVAHSAGCLMVAHWARASNQVNKVAGALLAVPPDFETPMPQGYPTIQALEDGGWFPIPRQKLPFRAIVGLSQNDPLGSIASVEQISKEWGAEIENLGDVGHLNPASNFGEWPYAQVLIGKLKT